MLGISIRKSALEKLVEQGKLMPERIGDSETGRFYFDLLTCRYYYRKAHFDKGVYIRDDKK